MRGTQPVVLICSEELELEPEAGPLLQQLKGAGFILVVTTNQPGLSRAKLSRRELDRMHELLHREYPIDEILVCPHDQSDLCPCRKPKPGLLIEAAFNWHLDLDHSFVISEKWQDAEAAHNAGCTSLLLESPLNGHGHHDFILPTLDAAVQRLLQLHTANHFSAA
jgi:D-glycero-D-manno-heptose 1,7-bisphosphate phosphatase